MKKFTFLLSLLLAFVGLTASAQDVRTWKKLASTPSVDNAVTDLSTLRDGGTYAFYSVGKSKYVKIANYENLHFGNTSTLSADDDQAGLAVFKFHITKDGESTTYQFETALEGYYMGEPQNGATYATTTPATFEIKSTDVNNATSDAGNFCITSTPTNSHSWFDMQNDQFCGWQGKDANCWYKIVPVTVSDETATYCKVTYNQKKGDEVLSTKSEWVKEGSTVSSNPFINVSYYYTTTLTNSSSTVAADNVVFNYSVTKSTMPFETGKWYTMQTRYNQAAYKDNSFLKVAIFNHQSLLCGNGTAVYNSYEDVANSLWKIEESGLGVKIKNLATGLYVKNGDPSTLDATGSVFYVKEPGTNNAQFTLYFNGSTWGNHCNKIVEYVNNTNRNVPMTTWNSQTDGGSNFTIADASLDAFITSAKTALTNTLTTANAGASYVNYEVGTALDAAKAKVATATTIDELQNIYKEAAEALNSTAIEMDESAIYRLKIADSYITTDGMFVGKDGKLSTSYNGNQAYDGKNLDRTITRSTANAALASQLWKFVKTGEGSYQLKNFNTRCNIAFFANGNLDMPIDETYGQSISVKPILAESAGSNANVAIVWGNQKMGIRGTSNIGTNTLPAGDAANVWQIEKVTSIPVSISDAKYASVAYPFATQVTGDVKAYYASAAENGALTLSEYPDGIIPANEGAIIYNEGGATTATLNVVSTENTVENNLLKPATAKRAGFTAGETYVLAKNSSNEAAFLKSELTVVPANKAYIEATSLPTSSESQEALSFNFGGDVTGINAAVAADKANTEYYDLQGRRVLYPVHGIFVTNTGKKVLVK